MRIVVFAENEGNEPSLVVDDGKRIEFVIPNYVVRFFQGHAFVRGDEAIERGHKGTDLFAL